MTQRELHRAIARATGESMRTIQQFGFSALEDQAPLGEAEMPDAKPQVVDWDQLDADRIALAIQA